MDYTNNKYAGKIQQKLEALDLEKGLGIFADAQYKVIPDTRFLIVSYGGTGADALEAVKTNLEKYMDKEDLETKVAFLAIDTDQTVRNKKVKVKKDGVETTVSMPRFDASEFFWLNNQPGRQALMIEDVGMKQWINPRLKKTVNADSTLMDGNGASGIRQLGRAMLYPAEIIEGFQSQFVTLVRRLTDNNGDNLKIFVLSGISGGTGSGIVVDATYLMHDFIRQMSGGIPARTEFAGFLLLPPTGTSDKITDIQKGNRNGIAALKEIDRFMSIAQRGERYRTNLGGRTLDIGKNIFKTCYLLDGGTSNVTYGNARQKANTVVADCILDMITSLPLDSDGAQGNTQVVDAFMSDASTFARAMLQTTSEKLAPREANYVYCALGHGKTLIPLNLMKAYVAKRLFDQMCATFDNCSKVDDRAAKNFADTVKKLETGDKLRENLEKLLRPMFKDEAKGPYYVINLLNGTIQELEKDHANLTKSALALDKKRRLEKLETLIAELRRMNNSTFTVYVTVMEEMKRYLNKEHKIICDSKLLERYGGSTYTFYPISFGGTDEKSAVVKKYLDGLVNQGNVDRLVRNLLDEMDSHRREWTDLAERTQVGAKQGFDAVKRIREFWQKNIDEIVKATVEDYLLKLYSSDPKASWPKSGDPDPKTVEAMENAAKAIVKQMWGRDGIARPLADLRTSILTMPKFNGHNTLLIPQAAPHLREYVAKAVADQPENSKSLVVAGSMVNDRISCYAQYTGIPAFMFGWVERAEPDYEELLRSDNVGLHMSETRGGEQWASFPSLMVESIWPMSAPAYDNPREHRFGLLAKDAFESAKALGLTRELAGADAEGAGNSYYYKLFSLPANLLPDRLLLKDVDIELEGKEAHMAALAKLEAAVEEKAQAIFALSENWGDEDPVTREGMFKALQDKGQTFVDKDLRFTDSVMSCLPDENGNEPEGWTEGLAARLLRTIPFYLDQVRETVMVLDKVYEKIEKVQAGDRLLREFSHYRAAKLFASNEDEDTWTYWDNVDEEEKILVELVAIDDAQMKAKDFFLYKAFEENAEEIIQAMQPSYKTEIFNEDTGKLDNAKLKKLKEESLKLADEVKTLRTAKDGVASLAFAKLAKLQGHSEQTVEEIKAFYKKYEQELTAGRMNVLA